MKEIKRIGVTGANGNIGQEVMRQGTAYSDKAFVPIVRNKEYIENRRSQGLEVIELDSARTDSERISSAIESLDSIIHLAARTSENNDFAAADLENHQATRNLAEAASREGIALITTGSIAQFTRNKRGQPINHTTEPESTSAYGKSKINGHKAAKSFETPETELEGYKTIQVVPGATIGPDATWTHYLVKQMKNPVARFLSGLMLNTEMGWTDKADLAKLFIQIAINPYAATTDRYIAVNGMGSTNEIFATMAEIAGVKPPSIPLPKKLIEPIGVALLTAFNKKAPVSPEAFSFGLHGHERQFSSDAAREDYNWQTKTLEQTLKEIKEGYKPNNNT